MGDKYDHSSVDCAGYALPELLEKLKRGDLEGFGRTEFLMGAIRESLPGSRITPAMEDELREHERRSLVNDARRLLGKLKRRDLAGHGRPETLVGDILDTLRKAEVTAAALDPTGRASEKEMLNQMRDAEKHARAPGARQR